MWSVKLMVQLSPAAFFHTSNMWSFCVLCPLHSDPSTCNPLNPCCTYTCSFCLKDKFWAEAKSSGIIPHSIFAIYKPLLEA